MTAFLRKKNKEDAIVKPVPSAPIPLAAAAPPPPLFARFATTARSSSDGMPANQRIVSSPMVLSSNVRKELPQRVSSRAYGHAPPTRDLDAAKRRPTQNQGVYKSLPPILPEQPPLTPTFHAPILDKPLPLPSSSTDPSGSTPPQSSMLATKQNRAPPSAFQNQPQGRPRASLDDAGNRESKQFSRPPSSQSFYSGQTPNTDESLISNHASRSPTANNNNPITSPPRRKASLSNTKVGPQILPPIANRKMHQNPPASLGRQIPPTTAQTQTPHLLQRSVANQDLQLANINGNMPMIGAPSSQTNMQSGLQDTQGTPISDRGIDLPPEFALFQEFSQFAQEDRNSVYSHRTPNTINHNEHVPVSNVPRSKTYSDSQSITPRPSTRTLAFSQESILLPHRQPEPQLPLPPPPLPTPPPQSESGMGLASSHAIGNGLLPSSMKDFYPSRVLTNANVRTSLYNNTPPNPANQPQMLNRHDRSISPPLPHGTASPFLNQVSRSEVPSNRMQIPRLPSFQDLQQPIQYNLQSSGSPSKSVNLQPQAPTVPMKGKPRIFAAMAAQEDELEQLSTGFQPSSGPPQHVRPSPSTMYVQRPQPQHQPSAPELSAYTNGSDPVKAGFSSSLQPQPQPQPPAPSTPKYIFEQLPPTPPSHSASRNSRLNGSRSLLRQDEGPQSPQLPQTPSRNRKLSKARTPSDVGLSAHHPNGSNITLPGTPDSYHRGANGSVRTFTKSRPTTPIASPHKPLFASPMPGAPLEPAIQLDEDTISKAGIPLDDDPFARVEGVTLLRPSNSLKEKEKEKEKESSSNGKKHRTKQSSSLEDGSREEEWKNLATVHVESEKASAVVEVVAPPTPTSPEEHRKIKKTQRDDDDNQTERTPSLLVDGEDDTEDEPEPVPQYTMVQFLSDPQLLSSLLTFLSFYDWCVLSSLSKEIRMLLVRTPVLRETVLERFLKTVGYLRWHWDDLEPLSLSLQDLSDYMRGVSTPTHEYARVAGMYVHSLTVHPNHRDPSLLDTVRILTASTRAYTRVILRLRAQAEKEAILAQQSRGLTAAMKAPNFNSSSPARGTHSRVSSRAPSPTASSYSHSHSYSISHNGHVGPPSSSSSTIQQHSSQTSLTFRSPLFRLRRAPLLRVFVPSPEGDWLSDKSVLACEAECKRAGVTHLMRLGDVVWDVAVGDEGNVGRLVWDGSYLIDLDYTYSSIGDLPKYMPTLAFPPSYFHRVIRTGPIVSNPIVHIDISPWGEEIAMNLQLLQDRVRTETPQGAYHNVVRWVHRSYFVIRPPRGGPGGYSHQRGRTQVLVPRIPIPDTDNLFVDSGWYGMIVVETEGTNEALADLQERCGPGAFPPKSRGVSHQINQAQIENKKVFRILREKSRPSEIWIKAVGIKERLL